MIGIDVNPSIELSVNRNEKVLQANPLNEDAETILDDMNLKNVDLDIAVNALIGSMVRNGYLDELDNAILVTVSNENEKKGIIIASGCRRGCRVFPAGTRGTGGCL